MDFSQYLVDGFLVQFCKELRRKDFVTKRDGFSKKRKGKREYLNGSFPEISKDASLNIISDLLQHYPTVLVTDRGEVLGIITKADLFKIK